MVHRVTDQEMQRFGGNRAFGEITSIDGNQIKVRNPRQGDKTIVVNDQTVFMKDGQPITLKDLKAGDRVLFGKYSGSEIKLDGEEFIIMREDEILGIINRAGEAAK